MFGIFVVYLHFYMFITQFLSELLTAFSKTQVGKHFCSVHLMEMSTFQLAGKTWVLDVYSISVISDTANFSDNMVLSVGMIGEQWIGTDLE